MVFVVVFFIILIGWNILLVDEIDVYIDCEVVGIVVIIVIFIVDFMCMIFFFDFICRVFKIVK